MKREILIVDDQSHLEEELRQILPNQDIIFHTDTIEEAQTILDEHLYQLILLGLNFAPNERQNTDGLKGLEQLKIKFSRIPVMVVSKYRRSPKITAALKNGADKYLYKGDLNISDWLNQIDELIQIGQSRNERLLQLQHHPEFAGGSALFQDCFRKFKEAIDAKKDILLLFNPGFHTKTWAEYFHLRSPNFRSYVQIQGMDGAYFMDQVKLESYLMPGHISEMKGHILNLADHGTYHLENVHSLGANILKNLPRFFETKELMINGHARRLNIHCLFTAILPQSPDAEQERVINILKTECFKHQGVCIEIPALGQRPEDIPAIAKSILQIDHPSSLTIAPPAARYLGSLPLERNVESLTSLLEKAIAIRNAEPIKSRYLLQRHFQPIKPMEERNLKESREIEKIHLDFKFIDLALAQSPHNKTNAAALIGLTPKTLLRKIQEHLNIAKQYKNIYSVYRKEFDY